MLPAHAILNEYLTGLSRETKWALMQLCLELERGMNKHPAWPTDVVHRAAVVVEEAGELQRAALHLTYERGAKSEVTNEAIQTGATCVRFLICSDTMTINNTLPNT